MRYALNIDKVVNQLVPHYLGGRRLILYLQSVLHPLQTLADSFSAWAKEKRIEASMTSQVFKFEWFLNRKFSVYFANSSDRIKITNSTTRGLALYYQSANVALSENPVLVTEDKHTVSDPVLYRMSESHDDSDYSFLVYSPRIDKSKINETDYISQLQYWIDRYRLAGKTYKIKFEQ